MYKKYNVILKSAGDNELQFIKIARETLGISLTGAKLLTVTVPKIIKKDISKSEADKIKAEFESIGAVAEIG